MGAGHPADPARQLVAGVLFQLLDVLPRAIVDRRRAGKTIELAIHGRLELVAGRDVQDVARLPLRRALALVVRGNPVFHQRGMPLVGENRRPQQPEPLPWIDEHRRVGVGIAGGVGEQEGLAPPRRTFLQARAADHDIVGGALAGAVEPVDEQVAVGRLDDHRGVVVPVLEREDQLGGDERRVLAGCHGVDAFRRRQGEHGEGDNSHGEVERFHARPV